MCCVLGMALECEGAAKKNDDRLQRPGLLWRTKPFKNSMYNTSNISKINESWGIQAIVLIWIMLIMLRIPQTATRKPMREPTGQRWWIDWLNVEFFLPVIHGCPPRAIGILKPRRETVPLWFS